MVNHSVVCLYDNLTLIVRRGSEFRKEFSNLGEVRSLMPSGTHVMALTATATQSSRRTICQVLGMEKVVVVSEVPDRPNIEYSLKKENHEIVFAPIVEELKQKRCSMDRVIVFCRTCDDAGNLYAYFRARLAKESFEPIGAPNLSKYRLFDLFTACTPRDVKKSIIDQSVTSCDCYDCLRYGVELSRYQKDHSLGSTK